MIELMAVGVGGFLGAIGRYWLSSVAQRLFGSGFPYGTLLVNGIGCLLFGSLWALVEYRQMFSPTARLLLTTGILGSLTTFSTFGYETFAQLRDEEYALAAINVAANVLLGLVAVALGWAGAKYLAS